MDKQTLSNIEKLYILRFFSKLWHLENEHLNCLGTLSTLSLASYDENTVIARLIL